MISSVQIHTRLQSETFQVALQCTRLQTEAHWAVLINYSLLKNQFY